jgi:hypothetical protein
MLKDKAVIQAPKSNAALRSVRLTADAAATLNAHKISQAEREL